MVMPQDEFLRPLCRAWESMIAKARTHRKGYDAIVEQCESFVAGPVGFMYEPEFRKKFLRGTLAPKFRITINRAFELWSLFAPTMYNRNPIRDVRPHESVEYDHGVVAEAFGVAPDQLDDMQSAYQQAMEMHQAGQPVPPELLGPAQNYAQIEGQVEQALRADRHERNRIEVGCALMQKYLSYTPKEQPDGGLKQNAEDALTEALTAGRGILRPDTYTFPGSDRVLTGAFFEKQANLLIDPDATRFEFGNCRWIAIRHVNTYTELERKFKLPNESLKDKATLESAEAQANREANDEMGELHRESGFSHDQILWWEVFSINGVGTRLKDVNYPWDRALDEAVGDFAYLAIANGVPWPLNAPIEKVRNATMEEVGTMFQWPIPYWLDRRWPVAVLDFFRWNKKPYVGYPLPPLAPGLGELTFLNVATAAMANRIWNASRLFVGAQNSIKATVEKLMNQGSDLAVFGVDRVHKDLDQWVKFFTVPDISLDMYRITDRIAEQFDRRVGLSELWYGMNVGGVASRSAKDAQSKESMAMIRPEKMADQVDDWMSEVAAMEKIAAYFKGVQGRDVRPLMGTLGAQLWDGLILNAEPEVVLRQMDATVQNGTAKKPNRAKDQQNMQQGYRPMMESLMPSAQDSGWTQNIEPINRLNRLFMDAMEMESDGLEIQPLQPPEPEPDPAAELELQKLQLETQLEQVKAQQEAQAAQQDLQLKAAEHQQETVAREETHDQKSRHLEEAHDLKLDLAEEKGKLEQRLARIKAAAQATAMRSKQSNGTAR